MARQPVVPFPTPRRHRSQDALDLRIAVIPPGHMLQLAAVALVIAGLTAWGFLGRVPTEVSGDGIMVQSGQQIVPVQGRADGIIARIAVEAGDAVVRNQVAAELTPFGIESELRQARDRLADLKEALAHMETRHAGDLAAREQAAADKLKTLEKSIALARQQSDRLQGLVADEEKLLARGYIRRDKVNETKSAYEDTLTKISELETQITEARAEITRYRADLTDKLEAARHDIHEQERAVQDAEERFEERRVVRSKVAGIVAEVRATEGETVGPDDVVATVAQGRKEIEVLGFLSPLDGRRVETGMTAHVVPTSIKMAEFGAMLGEVVSVSERPVSLAQIVELLRDETLAEKFVQDGVPYLARVRLLTDPATPSGFRWSAGQGPPFPIRVGSLVGLGVVVREQAPVSLVVPAVRQFMAVH